MDNSNSFPSLAVTSAPIFMIAFFVSSLIRIEEINSI